MDIETRKFHNPVDFEKPQVFIRSYLEVLSQDELLDRVLENLAKIQDQARLKLKLEALKIKPNPTQTELRKAIIEHIKDYERRVNKIQEFIPTHLNHIQEWLKKAGLTPRQNPESIPVYINDYLLHTGVENDFPKMFGEIFDAEHNAISVTGTRGLNILAHEYAHGMSHDTKTKRTGFRTLTPLGLKGNTWLDEGASMICEFATYPTEADNRRDIVDEMYDEGYYWITQLYIQELKITETELLKAYFGEEEYVSNLERKTLTRFGCAVSELNDIFIGWNEEAKEQTKKIIRGEAVTLEVIEGSGLDIVYLELQKKFPNVNVIVKPRPKIT